MDITLKFGTNSDVTHKNIIELKSDYITIQLNQNIDKPSILKNEQEQMNNFYDLKLGKFYFVI